MKNYCSPAPGQSRQRKQDTHDCRPGSRKSNTQKGLRIRVFSQPLVVSHLNCRPRIMPTVLISLLRFNAYVIYKELLNLLRPPVSVVFFYTLNTKMNLSEQKAGLCFQQYRKQLFRCGKVKNMRAGVLTGA